MSIALRSVNLKVDSLGTQERNTLIKNQKKESPSPIDSKVVTELVNEAINSILKSKLYGDTGLAKLEENIVKPTELFIKSLKELYSDYCAKTDRDKLVEKFYKLMQDAKEC